MSLQQTEKDIIIMQMGLVQNFGPGFAGFRFYSSPKGRVFSVFITQRELNLGFKGRVLRVTANITINSYNNVTGLGIYINGINNDNLLVIPAGTIGQFDSGDISDQNIIFEPNEKVAPYLHRPLVTAGLFQPEKILYLLEVLT